MGSYESQFINNQKGGRKMRLKNGAALISKSKIMDGGYVILAQKRISGDQMEYITWIADDDLNCYSGNYFLDLKEATMDYKKRVVDYV
jgi:hypothetical protein